MLPVEVIDTLVRLGLSVNQAKIYLALVYLGPSTVKQISKKTHVPRENIYRTIPTLFQNGLIKKIPSKPMILSATSLRDGCYALLNRKHNELFEIRESINEIHITPNKDKEKFPNDINQFLLIPEVNAIKMEELMAEKARKSIVGMVNLSRLQTEVPRISIWKRKARMGIKCKILFNCFKSINDESKFLDQLNEIPNFETRCINNPLDFTFAVYDKSETVCDVSGTKYFFDRKQESPRLWSNNSILVGMKLYIFETLWNTATEDKRIVMREYSQVG